jgi:ATP-dependent exoDNAse (exonuclease V) beta subunit
MLGSGKNMRDILSRAREEREIVPVTPGQIAQADNYLKWLIRAADEKNDVCWQLRLFDRPEQWGEIVRGALAANSGAEDSSGAAGGRAAEEERETAVLPPRGTEPFIKTTVSKLKEAYPWVLSRETAAAELTAWNLEEAEAAETAPETDAKDHLFARPLFCGGARELTPAEKGIAAHLYLQHIPLDLWRGAWAVSAQQTALLTELGEELTQKLILSPEQRDSLDYAQLRDCLNGELGAYLFRGRGLRREVPFLLRAERPDGPVLVQGVIDVLGEDENGRRFLIDYKTDVINAPYWENVLLKRYALQMAVYHRAVGQLSGRANDVCILYSISRRQGVEAPAARLAKAWAEAFPGRSPLRVQP